MRYVNRFRLLVSALLALPVLATEVLLMGGSLPVRNDGLDA
jgi:hypothetical protein